MKETSVGHLCILGHIVFIRSIILRAIPFVVTIWIVAAASCAVAAPTPAPAGGPPQIPHSLEEREGRCLLCHEEGVAGAPRVTAEHQGRTNDICTLCHIQASAPTPSSGVTPTPTPATEPPQIPHSLEEREGRCLLCHEEGIAGAPRVPVNHAGRTSNTCTACHQPAAAGTQTPAPTATPTPMAPSARPPVIPHPLEGRSLCLGCHGSGGPAFPQVPGDHAGRANEACTLCHSPTGTPSPAPTTTPTPTATPAATSDPVKGKELYAGKCAACHGGDATGKYGPSLTDLDPDDMEQAVRQGEGGMPAFGTNTITEQDLEDIMAYIAALASTGGGRQ